MVAQRSLQARPAALPAPASPSSSTAPTALIAVAHLMRHRAPPGTGGSDQSAPRTAPDSSHGIRARLHVLRIQQTLELAASSSARCRGDERGAAADDSAVGAGGGLSTGRSQAALSRLFHDHSPAHPRKARLRGTVCDVLASKGPLIFALRLGVLAGERSAVPRGLRRHSWPVIHLLSPCSLLGAVWYLTVRRSWARAAEMRFPSRAVAKDLGRDGNDANALGPSLR